MRTMLAGSPPGAVPEPAVLQQRKQATVVTYALLLVIAAVAWAEVLRSAMVMDDMGGMDMVMMPTVSDGVLFVVYGTAAARWGSCSATGALAGAGA